MSLRVRARAVKTVFLALNDGLEVNSMERRVKERCRTCSKCALQGCSAAGLRVIQLHTLSLRALIIRRCKGVGSESVVERTV